MSPITCITRRLINTTLLAILLGSLVSQGALAANSSAEVVTDHVRAQLVSSVDAVHPGAEILIGLHQKIIPHWHTYWRNSGDSGIPTTIDWKLPEGASAGDIQWPSPSRFNIGPITNYGYESQVTLLTSIQVPKTAAVGDSFPVHAKVNWLVCAEICVPEEVELDINLPVVAASVSSGSGNPLIKKALADLPVDTSWQAKAEYSKDSLLLHIEGSDLSAKHISDINFYPQEWGNILHNTQQERTVQGKALVLKLNPGESPVQAGQPLVGVLVVTEGSGSGRVSRGFNIRAAVSNSPPAAAPKPTAAKSPISAEALKNAAADESANLGLPAALLLAFLGGIILNLMPCVFPVLSIKALSLLNHTKHSAAETRWHGVAYTLGILSSFALLGILLIALKAGGSQVGWGFQFQSPVFVLVVAYLMFAVGLSLSGVFTIGGSVAGVGSSLAERPGYAGSFFTGVLATIVATPCTAPFMGAALGFALAQPPIVLLSVFLSLGLGLALPYLLLSTWPWLQRWLPRPGLWMERVKQVLAFPMYLAAVWLVWVLAQQAGANSVAIALGGMVAIAFAAWLYDSTRNSAIFAKHSSAAIAAIAVVLALVGGYWGVEVSAAPAAGAVSKHDGQWEPYSEERLQSLLAEGKPVFLNFTAAWCITCLANERVALSDSRVVATFKDAGITYLKGDWTKQDAQITKILKEFGRSGVPLYVAYAAAQPGQPAKPVVLPQILTPEIVLNAVHQSVNPANL